jgi:hypothetical protein
MPFVAPVIAAAGALAGGATIGAALATVGAGSALLGGIMVAGSALTTIGMVTGNAKLTKVGGLLSLAGGVGALASGAFNAVSDQVAQQAASQAGTEAASQGLLHDAMGTVATESAVASAVPGTGDISAMFPPAMERAGVGSMQGLVENQLPGAALDPVQQATQAVVKNPVKSLIDAGKPAQEMGVLDKVKAGVDWMEKNPTVTKLGAGILGGAMEQKANKEWLQEKQRLEEEADARKRARFNDSLKGLQMPTYQPKG